MSMCNDRDEYPERGELPHAGDPRGLEAGHPRWESESGQRSGAAEKNRQVGTELEQVGPSTDERVIANA
jgi:hypothetical protein